MRSLAAYVFVSLMTTALTSAREALVYFGTYTKTTSKGIYVSRFDLATGRLSAPELAGEATHPSFLALAADQRHLYAVGEGGGGASFNGKPTGAVTAFGLDAATGKLTPLNHVSSGSEGPCHVNIDPTGRAVVVANYSGGAVASLPILADGRLGEPASVIQHTGSGPNPQRQEKPHTHSVNFTPDGRLALVADLGIDQLRLYTLDAARATLAPATPAFAKLPPGSGPRHTAFSRDGRHLYVLNEIANTVTVFAYAAAAGTFTELQTLGTLPADFTGPNTTAEIVVEPSGRFVYASNRGHDSLAVFRIDPATGRLTLLEHVSTQGKNPRNFAIDPSGRWLLAANQNSDSVVVFALDAKTGHLTPTGQTVNVGMPVCVRFLELGAPK